MFNNNFLSSLLKNTEELPPLEPWMVPACLCVLALAQYMKPGLSRIFLTFPVMCWACLNLFQHTVVDGFTVYSAGTWAACFLLQYLDRIILTDESEFRYIGRQMVEEKRTEGQSTDFNAKNESNDTLTTVEMSRLRWALSLPFSIRGVGWSWQVKGVPLVSPLSKRWSFVIRKAIHGVFATAVTDVVGSILSASASRSNWRLSVGERYALEFCSTLLYGVWIGLGIKGVYDIVACCFVLLGITEPWQWPSIYGAGFKCFRIRTFWSTTYHQLFRRLLQSPAIRLCRLLRFPKGSFASRYTQLYVAFLLSALIHFCGSLNLSRSFSLALKWGDFIVFPAQAVAITLEDLIVWFWLHVLGMESYRDNKNVLRFEKLVGRISTATWLMWTLWLALNAQNTYGAMNRKYGARNSSWGFISGLIDG